MTWDEQEAQAQVRNEAKRALAKTDFVVIKAAEKGLLMSEEWLAWREQLRAVARNESSFIPPEPARLRAMGEPIPVEIPNFLLEPEVAETVELVIESVDEPLPADTIPAELLDLVRENEAYGDTQTRLWSLYLELNGKLMLGLATEEEARLHTRLHGHLAWISKGAAEVV